MKRRQGEPPIFLVFVVELGENQRKMSLLYSSKTHPSCTSDVMYIKIQIHVKFAGEEKDIKASSFCSEEKCKILFNLPSLPLFSPSNQVMIDKPFVLINI